MTTNKLNRRGFLYNAGAASIALLGNLNGITKGLRSSEYRIKSRQRNQMDMFMPDAEVSITAAEKWVQVLPSGPQTRVWGYEGQLLSGTGVSVTNLPGNYLGPILRMPTGTKIRIFFHNNLAEDSVIHPHGLRVPEDCDGHPMTAIGPGETKVYEFEVIDPAGPYWFHPHPHMRTAEQVVMGLAGLFYVTDMDEQMAVPGAETGLYDIPVIIQDRNFDSNNQILYNPNQMWGYLGSRMLVNGKADATMNLEPHAYRLRIVNGSNARTYKLAWSNGMPLNVIGTDGGLLPAVETRNYVVLMPGERIDIWADFSSYARKSIKLRSLAFSAMMGGGGGMGGMSEGNGVLFAGADCGGCGGGGGGGGGGGMGLANGAAFDIMTVNVSRRTNDHPQLGPLPPMMMQFDETNVPNYYNPRPFTLEMSRMVWTINYRVFEMMEVAMDEMVNLGDVMAWEWINNSPIPHPMHMHNVQFQVCERIPPSNRTSYDTVSQGFVDSGWKDTVIVWPGEQVKIAMMFMPHAGMYMYHCHILEHEDMTMMRNYMIMNGPMEM